MTSPDPNAALLAQLQAGGAAGASSNEELMALLAEDPEPDPLAGVEYTDDGEVDALAELDALHAGFRERAEREADRVRLATDTEYWFCVCFRNREDKDAFLAASGLTPIGDKYLDGYATARFLGIAMPPKAPADDLTVEGR